MIERVLGLIRCEYLLACVGVRACGHIGIRVSPDTRGGDITFKSLKIAWPYGQHFFYLIRMSNTFFVTET